MAKAHAQPTDIAHVEHEGHRHPDEHDELYDEVRGAELALEQRIHREVVDEEDNRDREHRRGEDPASDDAPCSRLQQTNGRCFVRGGRLASVGPLGMVLRGPQEPSLG